MAALLLYLFLLITKNKIVQVFQKEYITIIFNDLPLKHAHRLRESPQISGLYFFNTIFIEGTNITISGLQNGPHNISSHLNDGSDKQLWAFINL